MLGDVTDAINDIGGAVATTSEKQILVFRDHVGASIIVTSVARWWQGWGESIDDTADPITIGDDDGGNGDSRAAASVVGI